MLFAPKMIYRNWYIERATAAAAALPGDAGERYRVPGHYEDGGVFGVAGAHHRGGGARAKNNQVQVKKQVFLYIRLNF